MKNIIRCFIAVCMMMTLVPTVMVHAGTAFINPLPGGRMTQGFGDTRTFIPTYPTCNGIKYYHNGVDYSTGRNSAVVSSAQGTVKKIIRGDKYLGNYVMIRHVVNGTAYVTQYAHLNSVLVTVGQVVSQGQQIGVEGNTGYSKGTTGIHLHFSIFRDGAESYCSALNPLSFVGNPNLQGSGVTTPTNNQAHYNVDNLHYFEGKIYAKGWAFTTQLQPAVPTDRASVSYYLFLMDAATNKELARTQSGFSYRKDVASAFSKYRNVGYGGFNTTFQMKKEWEGKSMYLLVRFSADVGGDIAKVPDISLRSDAVMVMPKITGAIDSVTATDKVISATGWHATSKYTEKLHRYLFVMDSATNTELGRYRITPINRTDVQRQYPYIPGAQTSGFNMNIPIKQEWRGKKIYVVSRYATRSDGEGIVSELTDRSETAVLEHFERGSLDSFTSDGASLKATGWHISTRYTGKEKLFVFVRDAATNTELYRKEVTPSERKDIEGLFSSVTGSRLSGYNISIPIKTEWKGKTVYIMTRYANALGDGSIGDVNHTTKPLVIPGALKTQKILEVPKTNIVSPVKLEIPSTVRTIKVQEQYLLNTVITPKEGKITYISSNPEIATVSETGNITGIRSGTATITVQGSANGTTTTKVFTITVI